MPSIIIMFFRTRKKKTRVTAFLLNFIFKSFFKELKLKITFISQSRTTITSIPTQQHSTLKKQQINKEVKIKHRKTTGQHSVVN